MDANCSPSELRKSKCGDVRGSPFAVRKLLECNDDITGHLQSCNLSKLVGNVEEHEGGGGGSSSNAIEFHCDMYPQGGDFDHLIFQLQRAEEN